MLARDPINICKHFDPSVDAESRYYKRNQVYPETSVFSFQGDYLSQVYDLNATMIKQLRDYESGIVDRRIVGRPIVDRAIVNSSCIGESPGKELDQCEFNGYLSVDELCNPCEVKEFKEQCEYLCVRTAGTPFGPYKLM